MASPIDLLDYLIYSIILQLYIIPLSLTGCPRNHTNSPFLSLSFVLPSFGLKTFNAFSLSTHALKFMIRIFFIKCKKHSKIIIEIKLLIKFTHSNLLDQLGPFNVV
jgi:hypothetical protein